MTILITGASSGIGEACARAFAKEKRDLILLARRKDRLQKLSDELKVAHGVRVETIECDIQDRAAVERALGKRSGVEVLINNAGLALGRGSFQEGNPEDWDAMIDTNVKGLLYVTRALLPKMIAAKSGHIVNLGSVAGHWVYPGGNVYCASKYAVAALTEALRLDVHGTGLRVTEISPGMVETEFSKVRFKGDEKTAEAVYQGMTPLSPEDIAETIVWCVSRPKHVNVQNLVIYPTDQASVGMVHRGK